MSRRKPRPPEHLDETAQTKWGELVGSLPDAEPATLDALSCYCQAWSRWQEAEQKIREHGTVVRASGGTAAISPYVTVSQQAQRMMRQWAGELKFTPAARKGQRHKQSALQILTARKEQTG